VAFGTGAGSYIILTGYEVCTAPNRVVTYLSVSVTGGLIGYTGHTNCIDEYAALLSNSVDVTFR
jgi:hypothetical protein